MGVDDILALRPGERFGEMMAFQADRAISYYDLAFSRLPWADRRSQRAGLVMAAIYRTLLEEIRSDGFRVLDQRVALTPLRKLWLAWKTWIAA
jgi:phytoene synthase